ncbi:MAG: glycerol-3-phosphate dehydrogenase [Muribaculum sp.]|nr:glycerol-3-phosphate dehydrogenase [Muribaculaceae bacterium]MCM1081497.1 glycerol-3-phosphate dehydrogenase [Muribaculum sp.]
MGGGSWATALSKLMLQNMPDIIWYMRRNDRIEEFQQLGHNPAYLTDVEFPVERIEFLSDINLAASKADTLLMAMPSPYFKSHLEKLTADISTKKIVIATKGIIPDDNALISDYMVEHYHVAPENIMAVSGPCHAEEVALGRRSYLTVASPRRELAEAFAEALNGKAMSTLISDDVNGIEYAGVLKNVYAIGSGIIHGLKTGDNFQAIFLSNAIREMERFIQAAVGGSRNICDSVYLGDLLVTGYSRFSRNHNFGSMLGRGGSVRRSMMEMEMVAEGYYGTKCLYEINSQWVHAQTPLLNSINSILYNGVPAARAVRLLATELV